MADPVIGNIHLQLRAGKVVRPALSLAPALYWRDVAPGSAPSAQQSTRLVLGGSLAAAGSLLTTKGAALETSFGFPGVGSDYTGPEHAGNLPGRMFASPALAAQSLPVQLWTFVGAGLSGSSFAHTYFSAALYLWRPSTGAVVSMLYDTAAQLGATWNLTNSIGCIGKIPTPAADVEAGDVVVLEVFQTQESGNFVVRALASYDGTTDVVNGQSIAGGAASFVRPAVPLVFL